MLRGSKKFPSILGIDSCSILYWAIQVAMFVLALFFYRRNMHIMRVWTAPAITLGEQLFERDDTIEKNEGVIVRNSIGAGIFSGLGMGGGIFMIPMFRMVGLSPVQSSASGGFAIFIAAFLNVLQALFLGILTPIDFCFFFSITCFGSFGISYVVGSYLRKIHRTSLVELLLFLLLSASSIYLPLSLVFRVMSNDWNWSIVLSFGSIC